MPNTTTYTWDEENRLASVTLPNGSSEEYSYAADGLRRSKTKGTQTTRFLWDEENLLQEQSGSQILAHYTNQPDGYGPLLSQRRSDGGSTPSARFKAVSFGSSVFNQSGSTSAPASSFYGFDLSANTKILTDESGDVSDRYVNTAFGKSISDTGSTPNTYRFGGEVGYYQDSSDRSYVRARHYFNRQGRWINRDPIGFSGGDWNLYRYAESNPIYWVDPLGTYVVLVRGGPGYDPGVSAFPALNRFIRNRCKEAVFEPQFDWVMARAPGDIARLPKITPPDSKTVYDILCQIYRWLKTKRPSSDPKGLWFYGHSYGGHIIGQIANPSSEEIRGMKARIQKEFGVTFKRYVTAVGNAAAYPSHFSHIHYNLYSLSGDQQLIAKNRTTGEGWLTEQLVDWWKPSSYNTRGLRPRKKYSVPVKNQKYYYSGGKDRVIQGPNTPSAVPGRNGVPRGYSGPLWFDHVSFDARQGLSQIPYYRNQMIQFITRYLMAGHPGCPGSARK